MSSKAGYGGVGGYGGISTMNQEGRGSRYGPHNPVVRYLVDGTEYEVKCLMCKQEWSHPRDERKFPMTCGPIPDCEGI